MAPTAPVGLDAKHLAQRILRINRDFHLKRAVFLRFVRLRFYAACSLSFFLFRVEENSLSRVFPRRNPFTAKAICLGLFSPCFFFFSSFFWFLLFLPPPLLAKTKKHVPDIYIFISGLLMQLQGKGRREKKVFEKRRDVALIEAFKVDLPNHLFRETVNNGGVCSSPPCAVQEIQEFQEIQ
jgi:hypothetical protein